MSLRIKLAAITSAMLLAGGLGVALAAPASAVDNQSFCVYPSNGIVKTPYCATPAGSNQTGLNIDMDRNGGIFHWNVPPSSGQISTYSGGSPVECMQVDASEANEVLTAPCQGRASEEWTAIGEGNGNVEFKNHDDGLCLNTKNDSFHLLNAATCNGGTNELFFGRAG